MTADAGNGSGTSDAPFESVDSRLTIYALANGMDLDKSDTSRRLGWFREGLDRGILIEAGADGAVAVHALAWKSGDEDSTRRAPVADGLSLADFGQRLTDLLAEALEAANGL